METSLLMLLLSFSATEGVPYLSRAHPHRAYNYSLAKWPDQKLKQPSICEHNSKVPAWFLKRFQVLAKCPNEFDRLFIKRCFPYLKPPEVQWNAVHQFTVSSTFRTVLLVVNENNGNPTCGLLGSQPIRSVVIIRPIGLAIIWQDLYPKFREQRKLMGQGQMGDIETSG